MKMTEGVKLFLSQLGMLNYYDMFLAKGFELETDIPHLTSQDLEQVLMISCQRDREIILSHAHIFQPSQEHAVYEWLHSNSLDHYFISFVQSELTDLRKIAQLALPNEELYDELELVLPGHRKRLERAVQKLQANQSKDMTPETPITHGWWGKPDCLPQAKFDFLCVTASVFSVKEPHNVASVDFMVDSGSDVSTIQEDTLKGLNLELMGTVYSCGIHGGNHTNLYKARLRIGSQEMDIEVMGSNYDSLGSRVVRHFRHVIDGRRHIWLKGNYKDPHPVVPAITLPVSSASTSGCTKSNDSQASINIPSIAHSIPENNQGTNVENGDGSSLISRKTSKASDAELLHNQSEEFSHLSLTDLTKTGDQSNGEMLIHPPREASVLENSAGLMNDTPTFQISNGDLNEMNLLHCNNDPAPNSKGKRSTKSSYPGPKSSNKRKLITTTDASDLPQVKNQRSEKDPPQFTINAKTDGTRNPDPAQTPVAEKETNTENIRGINERVSFKHLIPPSLRDTDDDIDSAIGTYDPSNHSVQTHALHNIISHSPSPRNDKTSRSTRQVVQHSNGHSFSNHLLATVHSKHSINISAHEESSRILPDAENSSDDVVHVHCFEDEQDKDTVMVCEESVGSHINTDVGNKDISVVNHDESLNGQNIKSNFVQADRKIVVITLDDL